MLASLNVPAGHLEQPTALAYEPSGHAVTHCDAEVAPNEYAYEPAEHTVHIV